MNRDPFGLGALLYGVRPNPARTLTAAAWVFSPLGEREFELAHAGCAISTFCKNPLHPGPCKGWKKSLGVNAPGALKAIEAARKEKLTAKRAATSEAKSAAEKLLTSRHLASPLHAKKATIKHANILLGNDEAKASGKADKVILNKAEIKKYSKIKAAHINSIRTKHGLEEDPGLEDRLAEALAKDNAGGKDDNYRAAVATSGDSFGAQLAEKHCKKGDGDCDGKAYENLRAKLSEAAGHALLTGDDSGLDQALADYDAGKLDLTPAAPKAKIPQAAKAKALAESVTPKEAEDLGTAMGTPTVKPWTPQDEYLDHAKAVAAGKYDANPLQVVGLAGLINKEQFDDGMTVDEQSNLLVKLKSAHATGNQVVKDKAAAVYKKLTGNDIPGGKKDEEPDLLQQLLDAVPMSGGSTDVQKKAVAAAKGGGTSDAAALNAYDALTKDDFDGLTKDDQDAIINDLESIQNLVGGYDGDKALEIQAKLMGLGPVKSATPAAPAAPAPSTSKYLGGVSTALLKDAFGDNGDPNHQEAVHLVNGMNQIQWDQLNSTEKSYAVDHINDAMLNGEPGADQAGKKLKALGAYGVQMGGPGAAPSPLPAAPALSPDAQTASDLANGFKSGTAKMKLAAYEKVSGEEFKTMKPNTQKLMLASLLGLKDKFADPKKKAAQDHHDYLSPFMGGGAGAGGGGNPAVNDADKLNTAKTNIADMGSYVTTPGTAPDVSGAQDAYEGLVNASGLDAAAAAIAPIWADNALKKFDDAVGGGIDPGVLAAVKPAVAADIEKMLKGETGATPHWTALKKAIQTGDEQAAADFLSGAGGVGGGSTFGAPPTHAEKAEIVGKLQGLWQSAVPDVVPPPSATLDKMVGDASVSGLGSDAYKKFVDDQGDLMAMVAINHGIKNAGLSSTSDVAEIFNSDDGKIVKDAMAAELATAFKGGATAIPSGGPTDKMAKIAEDTLAAADTLGAKNNWDPDSQPVQDYTKALLSAKLEDLAKTLKPVPAVPSPSATPTPAPGAAPIGTGTGIAHIPLSKQEEILGDLKGLPNGKYLSDPKDVTYGNLLALAAAHGTTDEPLSVMQVLQSIDNAFSKQLGVPNSNKWEGEFVDWLKTPDGSAFAAANPTADASLVKKFQGVYGGPSTDLAELAKKVKLHPGPGEFDAGKPSSDFATVPMSDLKRSVAAEQLSKDMFAGKPWTEAQKQGVYTYTGGTYSEMNGWLRGENSTISPSTKTAIKNTQDAMRPVTKDIVTYRGTGWEQLPEGFRSPGGAKKLIGQVIMDEAFLSTSVDPDSAFGGPLRLEVEVPKGSYAVYASGYHPNGDPVSQHNNEVEMLLAAGGHYHVMSVTQVGHQTVMRVRVVNAV